MKMKPTLLEGSPLTFGGSSILRIYIAPYIQYTNDRRGGGECTFGSNIH